MQDLLTNCRESEGAFKPPNAICKLRLVTGLRPDLVGERKRFPDQGADWPAKKEGYFPVAPTSGRLLGPCHTREFISLIIS